MTQQTAEQTETVLHNITCSQCGASAIVRREDLAGWKVQHQASRHFGHPWSAFLVKKAVQQ